MNFWDSSAIIPLCIDEPHTSVVHRIHSADPVMVVWWGSRIECLSALARGRHAGGTNTVLETGFRKALDCVGASWVEIEPAAGVREIAARLLFAHPLRSGDALQLAAALAWSGGTPQGYKFVCLDRRLRDAARKEGFRLLPEDLRG